MVTTCRTPSITTGSRTGKPTTRSQSSEHFDCSPFFFCPNVLEFSLSFSSATGESIRNGIVVWKAFSPCPTG